MREEQWDLLCKNYVNLHSKKFDPLSVEILYYKLAYINLKRKIFTAFKFS